MMYDINNCSLCPRNCQADRTKSNGVCRSGEMVIAARASLHYWEEPCISGTNGSGTIFFSGCALKCCFCQNYNISHQNEGKNIDIKRLSEIFLELKNRGAHNINLVNPTHFVPQIISALDNVKDKLEGIPIVYNCGGYEKIETLELLKGYIDIYLPDLKYMDNKISERYSKAENYFEYASKAIKEMHRQQSKITMNGNIMKSGLIIRHMVIPGCRHDSLKLLNWLYENLPVDSFLLSLMSQFTPTYKCKEYPEINRRITTFEYNSVTAHAADLGFKGYTQSRSSADSLYTPDFNLEGI
ncbi:MAG: radical SAM protein [Oscillospiraceae bacterium]|nr:radical SAM protein [Oscillospiraceae bacterium]